MRFVVAIVPDQIGATLCLAKVPLQPRRLRIASAAIGGKQWLGCRSTNMLPSRMTKEVTLRQAGGSVSATLPKDMADRLRLEAGDRVLAVETDRGILLTPYDPDAERALRVAATAAKKYRNALRELAK